MQWKKDPLSNFFLNASAVLSTLISTTLPQFYIVGHVSIIFFISQDSISKNVHILRSLSSTKLPDTNECFCQTNISFSM